MGIYVKFTETFHFSPNFVLNFRKSYQIWENWLKNKKVKVKTNWGWNTPPPPPVLIGLRYWTLITP